ncbi:MFS transporter [Flavobacterium sp. GCM10027622]|uniref:MFS transporter n=1 Tax=unclassified Flavobacterium TaxID=196869 RepID=UPI0036071BA1
MKTLSKDQSHSKESYLYMLSKVFERTSYYGIRSFLVLYMLENLHLHQDEAVKIYGIFASSIIISQILGALLGDLLIGNRRAQLIGGCLQLIGTLVLLVPTSLGLYLGLGLLSLGSGLFSPNLLAQFGKLYHNKKAIMDGAFTSFYTSINIGAILGAYLLMMIVSNNYLLGLITSSIFMLVSIIISFCIDSKNNEQQFVLIPSDTNKKALRILFSVFLSISFWYLYNTYSDRFYEIISNLRNTSTFNEFAYIYSINTVFILPVGIFFSVIWSFYYLDSKIKLSIGFLFVAIAMSVYAFIGENIPDLIASSLLITLAENLISPILLSVVTKNTNPKYLALTQTLLLLPSFLISAAFTNGYLLPNYFKPSIVLATLIGISLLVVIYLNKKKAISSI